MGSYFSPIVNKLFEYSIFIHDDKELVDLKNNFCIWPLIAIEVSIYYKSMRSFFNVIKFCKLMDFSLPFQTKTYIIMYNACLHWNMILLTTFILDHIQSGEKVKAQGTSFPSPTILGIVAPLGALVLCFRSN